MGGKGSDPHTMDEVGSLGSLTSRVTLATSVIYQLEKNQEVLDTFTPKN